MPSVELPGSAAPKPNDAGSHPPRPRFVLSVGIIGHRPKDLGKIKSRSGRRPNRDVLLKKIADDVKAGLSAIKAAALQARGDHARCFEKGSPAELILVSALAEGADRIAADAGLDLGYVLQSPLPFARAAYREDFKHKPPAGKENDPEALALAAEETKASCDEFDRLCGRAASVLELPGQHRLPADSEEVGQLRENRAYEAAGLTVLSHSDIVLVIWDRELSRGRGGTAYLIAEAYALACPLCSWTPMEEIPSRSAGAT